jgi:hypothetical protein
LLAQALVTVEGALSNLTSASLDTISSYVNSNLLIVGEALAVFCTDTGGVLYGKTIKDVAYFTETKKPELSHEEGNGDY